MTKSTNQKRIDDVERQLTPKDWAIRIVDEMRKHRNLTALLETIAKAKSIKDSLVTKPYYVLVEQAEERHPGNKPENIHARNQLQRKLRGDFHMLKSLIFYVNETIDSQAESAGLKAALRLATLQAIILQDAFGRTASKAAEWIEEFKTADADDEENRQIMLKELAAFDEVYLGETFSDSLPLGPDVRIRFPSPIESWVQEITLLITDVFAHEAAVKIIQDKYFDGHLMLFPETESRLAEAIRAVQDGVAAFNDYLKKRAELYAADWEDNEEQDGIAGAIPGEREGTLTIDIAAIKRRAVKQDAGPLADSWMKHIKMKTIADMLEETNEHEPYLWNILQESSGSSS